jgi:hypothetical protein
MRAGSGTPPSATSSLRYCSSPPGDCTFNTRVGASLRFAKVWATPGGARMKAPAGLVLLVSDLAGQRPLKDAKRHEAGDDGKGRSPQTPVR